MRLRRPLIVAAFSLAAVACAPVTPREEAGLPPMPIMLPQTTTALSPDEINDIPWLLGYFRAVYDGPAETLAQEYRQGEQALRDDPSARNQLRMALLLSLPDTRYHSPARAQALLDKYLASRPAQDPSLQNLAYLLRIQIGEAIRQEENFRRSAQRLEKTDTENKTLREQLNGLKEIERALNQRQKGTATDIR